MPRPRSVTEWEVQYKNNMKLIKVTPLQHMASGVKFCALVEDGTRATTGFGVTEQEAIDNAEANLNRYNKNDKPKKKRKRF